MKYLLLIYGEEATLANMTADEKKAYFGAFGPYTQDLVQAGVLRGGDPLLPTSAATSVRVRGGQAVAWASRCPTATLGTIELRPVLEMPT